ncbi:Hypothetical predicted protein [Cloeon dipterum]|uniref:Uncharacterized protein n=1 Tax=Cloeon dipterum TaxID=197152 RepID=A0A8S1CJR2_9INSE|nr:Hypothetical predicted protein [Cloeon dipterum]
MSEGKREKNYFQHYRKKWEKIPQLRGWLSEAPSTNPEHAKAFCKYCQKKLVPHVTGLLKHASCRNHLKAAKEYVDKINAAVRRAQEKALSTSVSVTNNEDSKTTEVQNEPSQTEDSTMGEILTVPPESKEVEANDNVDGSTAQEDTTEKSAEPNQLLVENLSDDMETDMETVTVIMDPISHTKKLKVVTNPGPLSTHVLDTIRGSPAIGLVVTLYRLKDSRWTLISERLYL